ncbi:MAG TPA: hypothetical protein PLA94_17155 [Myxococcota bacterium]|nr:hypothetical protein [Myxococcota bacterium]
MSRYYPPSAGPSPLLRTWSTFARLMDPFPACFPGKQDSASKRTGDLPLPIEPHQRRESGWMDGFPAIR